jgi:ABC-2 type transport system ATP-binding protein
MADLQPAAARPVIQAKNLGIYFKRNRRRHKRLRDMFSGDAPPEEPVRAPRKGGKGKSTKRRSGGFWALRDVSFQVQPGEAVGLVGGNGQGKSTLLKLIAGVLLPDAGKISVRGGVAPLIEVTGGFEGDLTARDNIWLTAGLHGLSKQQIAAKFDEIVDFAEVGDFLDTPFRHFSSGMKVRLGFSVITTLDEPIVLVDEVLAVGDRAFREKCYLRMQELLSGGRTLFLVSHNEGDLKRFCNRGLYLKGGSLVSDGPLEETLAHYRADVQARRTQLR